MGILFAAVAIPSAPFVLYFLGAGEGVLPLASEYARALFRGAPFFAFSIVANNFVRTSDKHESEKYNVYGVYAALEGEVWLTRNTGFYASLTYDRTSKDVSIDLGERIADVSLDSGMGVRIGITTRF